MPKKNIFNTYLRRDIYTRSIYLFIYFKPIFKQIKSSLFFDIVVLFSLLTVFKKKKKNYPDEINILPVYI